MVSLHRFFVPPSQISDGVASITGPDARQIATVLRLRKGDSIAVLDGSGTCYRGEICSVIRELVTAAISETVRLDTEPGVYVALAQGLPKGDKFSLIVQKGTELGISEFVAVAAARSVTRPNASPNKQARWQRIAKEAAEQCCRARIPMVSQITSFADAVGRIGDFDLALMAWEQEDRVLLSSVLRENRDARKVILFVGPEGGFSPDEAEAARDAGARLVSLGRRILRTETAAIAASAIMLNELEGHL